jgi:putative glutathione S-transferase
MGRLVDGDWQITNYGTGEDGGKYNREASVFRSWITPDGSKGPTGDAGFEAESGRYHLYVSYACPWAHRTLIFLKLKGLEDHIGVSVVHPHMLEDGWTLAADYPGATGDELYGKAFLRELYLKAKPDMTGKVTVPLLWDKQRETVVSNESADIIRMLNSAFDGISGNTDDYWPQEMREAIEEVNQRVYHTVNNGVYKSGFASTQEAYDEAVHPLFDSLDWLENRLSGKRYLMGDRITEADWRLFTTLVRFDLVYHLHFKCNRARIIDYPNLWGYLRELYQWPGVAETVNFDHIVQHYHYSHDGLNPNRIIPINPVLDFDAPHGRG